VVVSPGWGDAVQASKAGIMEIAHVFVVNKADRQGADEAVRDIRQMLHMGPKMDWLPPIVRTSTVSGEGIDDLWEAFEAHRKHQRASGELEATRRRRVLHEVQNMVALRLRASTAKVLEDGDELGLAADLAARRVDPYRAADILLGRVSRPSEILVGESDG
jgi:LAO/AO transport system kinase